MPLPSPAGSLSLTDALPLACIIVHYGAPETTRSCLTSLAACNPRPLIILVCNSGREEAYGLRDALPSGTTVLAMGENRGFAAACNAGLRHARQQGIQYAWLLNNDAVAAPDAPSLLWRCLETHPRAVIGTSVFRRDRPDRLELALGCRFSPYTTILRPCSPLARPEDVTAPPQVDYVYGASMAFPSALVEDIGLLDETFFLYYEEHDFCLRARQAGYMFHWCREATVWHGRESAPAVVDKKARAFKHFHEMRSTVLFLRKHHRRALPFALGFRIACKLVSLLLRGEAWLLPSCFQGVWQSTVGSSPPTGPLTGG